MAMARGEKAEFLAMIAALEKRIEQLEKALAEKRGPGRPPKEKVDVQA